MKLLSLRMPKELKVEELRDDYGRFLLSPLERGFGVTIANGLRRILLSSIQGAAIVAIKVDGALHEFSVLPGVLEDMTEIILNLKKVRVQIRDGKKKHLYLNVKKKGEVNAGMIETTEGITIANPQQHIATITEDNGQLKFEMVADIGRGFVPSEMFKNPNAPVGTIYLDAIFSPIKRVNYRVETTRVGQRTDYEKLLFEIWTDKTIKPDEALALSAKILRDHINLLIKFEEEPEMIETEEIDKNVEKIRKLLNIKVSELELSVRSNNVMKQAHIKTLGDLVQRTEAEMLKFRNFGKKSLAEMNNILKGYGLSFGMDISKYKKDGKLEDEDFDMDMAKPVKTADEEAKK
ncbi:MAG: DNA-directed RNA polymerase subunit alpha [Candidatus Cloacimonas sp. 4484_209]|nr:MAG: DNA-directed RNA polymerase subunit alpha [Candidatus Cloacimonas sp. 4484_209]